jgi:hypothetical protein
MTHLDRRRPVRPQIPRRTSDENPLPCPITLHSSSLCTLSPTPDHNHHHTPTEPSTAGGPPLREGSQGQTPISHVGHQGEWVSRRISAEDVTELRGKLANATGYPLRPERTNSRALR